MRAPLWPDNPALFLDLDGTLPEFADDLVNVESGQACARHRSPETLTEVARSH